MPTITYCEDVPYENRRRSLRRARFSIIYTICNGLPSIPYQILYHDCAEQPAELGLNFTCSAHQQDAFNSVR